MTGSKVRLATLEVSIKLLKQLVVREHRSYLQDRHLACIENARECSTQRLRNFYKVVLHTISSQFHFYF